MGSMSAKAIGATLGAAWFRSISWAGIASGHLLLWFLLSLIFFVSIMHSRPTSAADDTLVNCNQLDNAVDRCDCNINIYRAINQIKPVVADPVQSPNATDANTQLAVQHERLYRLRTYIAP